MLGRTHVQDCYLQLPSYIKLVPTAAVELSWAKQVVPFTPPKHTGGRQQRGNLEQFLEGTVQYHGVVVQSAHGSDVQGCYVLKTVCNLHMSGPLMSAGLSSSALSSVAFSMPAWRASCLARLSG